MSAQCATGAHSFTDLSHGGLVVRKPMFSAPNVLLNIHENFRRSGSLPTIVY
jgi:hypothetical protein